MSFLESYNRLPRSTRLQLGILGIFFSVVGIISTPDPNKKNQPNLPHIKNSAVEGAKPETGKP